jgi:ketosteroid isomerase-like protein
MIRSSIKNDSRNIIYKSTSISIDGEFIIEVGIAEAKDDRGNQKWISKYLVVYKQENGVWKLYRDIGL